VSALVKYPLTWDILLTRPLLWTPASSYSSHHRPLSLRLWADRPSFFQPVFPPPIIGLQWTLRERPFHYTSVSTIRFLFCGDDPPFSVAGNLRACGPYPPPPNFSLWFETVAFPPSPPLPFSLTSDPGFSTFAPSPPPLFELGLISVASLPSLCTCVRAP